MLGFFQFPHRSALLLCLEKNKICDVLMYCFFSLIQKAYELKEDKTELHLFESHINQYESLAFTINFFHFFCIHFTSLQIVIH